MPEHEKNLPTISIPNTGDGDTSLVSNNSITTSNTTVYSQNKQKSSPDSPQVKSSSDLLNDPKVKAVLNSDNSLEILLARLKDSIRACDEFALYLKKKHSYEESYMASIKKTSLNCKNSVKSNTRVLKGSFIESLDKAISFDDRLVKDVRTPYAKALFKMYEELVSLSSNFSKLRKQTKEDGIRREKEVVDAIQQAEKAKSKYYSLCSDLEKLRNSDQTSKKITLQGRKTGSQQEEELTRKIQTADQDYNKKANLSQKFKNNLINTYRPELSTKLKDLILEIDHALQLQLTKFAVYNESLVIGMGNQLIPISSSSKSLKYVSSSVDVEKCLFDYLKTQKAEKKAAFIPIVYTKHALFNKTSPFGNTPAAVSSRNNTASTPATPAQTNSTSFVNHSSSNLTHNNSSTTLPSATLLAAPMSPQQSGHPQSYSSLDPRSPTSPVLNGPRAFNSENNLSADNLAVPGNRSSFLSTNSGIQSGGLLFGKPLESLPHDDEMIPLFVKKCIDLIETYGLKAEGLYRSSPNKAKLEELKRKIDTDPENLSLLDPPDPNNVTNDYVFVIASLLKKFFGELPDPVLTTAQADNFFKAGQIEDPATMHVQLHRIVFELPDASYFTLRDLLFHFDKIDKIPMVRMNDKNLAIVWSNNLLGRVTYNKDDLTIQQRVVEALILCAHDIYNPKD
ncbi:unnamed protein product [Ambrosiozyma monospora]|uniref:Unnamed protein product n=1 Tax=Ambrosiozyma monospora TaxID=43982 RepID=A0A9W7DD93_AMBMO|nr:unnamed protein product [Ambrosiozyma monospora]